jgi:hypothetical protein
MTDNLMLSLELEAQHQLPRSTAFADTVWASSSVGG